MIVIIIKEILNIIWLIIIVGKFKIKWIFKIFLISWNFKEKKINKEILIVILGIIIGKKSMVFKILCLGKWKCFNVKVIIVLKIVVSNVEIVVIKRLFVRVF